jgi:hypothetical protein
MKESILTLLKFETLVKFIKYVDERKRMRKLIGFVVFIGLSPHIIYLVMGRIDGFVNHLLIGVKYITNIAGLNVKTNLP